MEEYRKQLRLKREERERCILHRETTTINGVLCQITWSKKDVRLSSLDMTVIMTVYHAPTSGVFKFEISEAEMKAFAERDKLLNNFSYGEVLDVRNLVKLKTRLKSRVKSVEWHGGERPREMARVRDHGALYRYITISNAIHINTSSFASQS